MSSREEHVRRPMSRRRGAAPRITYERIWDVVRRIPRGRVATYGQIARLAGLAGHARQVGYALHALPGRSRVPWHRVINARGRISLGDGGDLGEFQRRLLETEGIEFDRTGRVDLARWVWRPRSA